MDKKKLGKILFLITLSALIPVFLEKFYFINEPFSIDRFMIFFSVLVFVSLHFMLDVKKIWDFIYKKRYIIGISFFALLVLCGYNGSSMPIYNGAIQGEYHVENGDPILGKTRVIRGDEWAVGTLTLSQDLPINNYSTINRSVMASDDLNVTFYFKMPCWDISILTSPSLIGYLILPLENAFSFNWYFNIFLIFFGTFELLMILTKKNKLLSMMGALIITFSPATQWWSSYNIIAFGELAVVCFYYYLKTESKWKKVLLSIAIGYFGACYIMTIYPAWMVPYGYFFLAIVVWMIYENRVNNNLKDYVKLLLIIISIIIILILPPYLGGRDIVSIIMNTSYPGQRISIGGYGWESMFKYVTNFLTPFTESNNASEMAQFICFYPIPMIMGVYYAIKNKGKDFLLNALLVVSFFLSVWNFIALPEIVANLTMLSMSTVERCNLTVGFVNLIILIICLNNYRSESSRLFNLKTLLLVIAAGLYSVFAIYEAMNLYPEFMTIKKCVFIFSILFYLVTLLLLNHDKTFKIFIYSFLFFSLVIGTTVHPINKGLNAVYEKPISKEIQKISASDGMAKWITVNSPYYLPNYAVANGARMINSTNYYPNFEFWEIFDPKEEYKDIYNRFAHVLIKLTDQKTEILKNYEDQIQLNLNINELSNLDVKYILSSENLAGLKSDKVDLNEIYNEYGLYIYEKTNK